MLDNHSAQQTVRKTKANAKLFPTQLKTALKLKVYFCQFLYLAHCKPAFSSRFRRILKYLEIKGFGEDPNFVFLLFNLQYLGYY